MTEHSYNAEIDVSFGDFILFIIGNDEDNYTLSIVYKDGIRKNYYVDTDLFMLIKFVESMNWINLYKDYENRSDFYLNDDLTFEIIDR